ncbi:D-TA family PLP-dependent enzyme [Anaerobacillus alkaliphilus]|uniref:D-TA family PLP-dependent enzyme n=1 Tax=Anaerobacillus alkaliphilus TaxID=1548597 RepID=A0A4Q0VRC1_9BACI|nr:alanine racemase [Anaerobacillus alkaliphilus]RXI98691.1 D-TA family PLP-dependent enzyme [Anaerobacillus alkaliphilus]
MTNSIHLLDTPALLLDLTLLENNLDEISAIAKKNQIQWRPHIKTHKSIHIAKMQLAKGACGITVAKLEEAEIMANSGIKDILIAYPISSSQKLTRLRQLTLKATLTIAIDSVEQAKRVNEAFEGEKPITVWLKVNSGLNRCGVDIEEVVEIASVIKRLSNLHFNGIFTHAGHSYAATSIEQIKEIAENEAKVVLEAAKLCEDLGHQITHKSIGSTPTFKYGAEVEGITEIRPGNAAFYDMCQVGLGVTSTSQCALTVLSSVVSIKRDRIIFDTGSKALSLDQGAHGNKSVVGYGKVINHPKIILARLSEEHGVATFLDKTDLSLTDKVQIIPNHACVVANLFDEYFVHRDGEIVDTWQVDARGKMR